MRSLFSLLCILLLTACQAPAGEVTVRTITEDGSFTPDACTARDLDGKVMMLESKHCGHCQQTKPDFIAACEAAGIEPLILDLSVPEELSTAKARGVLPQFTPTFIIDCDYYVGVRERATYDAWLSEVDA